MNTIYKVVQPKQILPFLTQPLIKIYFFSNTYFNIVILFTLRIFFKEYIIYNILFASSHNPSECGSIWRIVEEDKKLK